MDGESGMAGPGGWQITRRTALRALAWVGVAGGGGRAVLGASPAEAAAGNLASLGPEESVDATMKRLFAGRPIKDGGSAIKLDLPLIAENGAMVPVSVEVAAPQTAQSHVKAIYIISDKNRRPLNAKFSLTPAVGQAYIATNLRLGESTDVRAVVEMSDGTLLAAARAVKVTVGGCGG
jgi:sulfur-oxidizing protein SoxY